MSSNPTPKPKPTSLPIAQTLLQEATEAARDEQQPERAMHWKWQNENRHLCTCPDGYACEYCSDGNRNALGLFI